MINIPKGTKDMLPQEAYTWHYVENIARETAAEDTTISSRKWAESRLPP